MVHPNGSGEPTYKVIDPAELHRSGLAHPAALRSERGQSESAGTGSAPVRPDRSAAQAPGGNHGGPGPPRRRRLRRALPADGHEYRAGPAAAVWASRTERSSAGRQWWPDPYTATQEVVAKTNPVLLGALPDIRPAMSVNELRDAVQIGSLTPYVVSVGVKGKVAADAAGNANAVAKSYIRYIGSENSPGGKLPAQLLRRRQILQGWAGSSKSSFMHWWARYLVR